MKRVQQLTRRQQRFFAVRLAPHLAARIEAVARREGLSRQAVIERAIAREVKHGKTQGPAT